MIYAIAIAVLSALGLYGFLAVCFRRVVPTNMVHIVQSSKKTVSYGQTTGNVYYSIPSFVPYFGVVVTELPVSNFSLSLNDYDAYDKERVPFLIDVVAFFRIADTNLAARPSIRASTRLISPARSPSNDSSILVGPACTVGILPNGPSGSGITRSSRWTSASPVSGMTPPCWKLPTILPPTRPAMLDNAPNCA